MLKLLGFSASNYYNVAKLALLEKGLHFDEVLTWTGASASFQPEYLAHSPMGKVPCLVTDQGPISETRAIVEYLEDAFPERSLLPKAPFERARVRELCVMIDLYLELPVRRTLPNFFAGKQAPERLREEIQPVLEKAETALAARATIDPFLAGSTFTLADVAAISHFPVVSAVSKVTLGRDILADVEGLGPYMARMAERPTVQKLRADRDANLPAFLAFISKRHHAE